VVHNVISSGNSPLRKGLSELVTGLIQHSLPLKLQVPAGSTCPAVLEVQVFDAPAQTVPARLAWLGYLNPVPHKHRQYRLRILFVIKVLTNAPYLSSRTSQESFARMGNAQQHKASTAFLVLHDGLNQPVHPLLGYFVPANWTCDRFF